MPDLEENHLGDILRENLAKLGNNVTNGNCRAFSVVLGFGVNNAWGWLGGRHFPRPAVLFRICHRLQIPPLELLRRNGSCAVSPEIAAAGLSTSSRGAWRDDPERIKAVLLDALQEIPPPSLHEIANRFNYRTCAPLKRLDPDTCKQIARRYRAVRLCWYGTWVVAERNCTVDDIERILRESLAHERPIPVTQIAAQLGHESPQRLQTHFPELCKAIAQKAAQYRIKFREQMRVALVEAIAEKPPPTARSLSKRLKCSQSALDYHFPALCKQLQAARRAWKVVEYEVIRLKIEALATEMIGATVQEVCLKAGVTPEFSLKNFPALDRQIAAGYLARESERRKQRCAALRRDVQKAVTALSRDSLTPTLNRVIPLLSAEASRDWNRIQREISDATRQLNLATTVEA
jgi:transcriptional regulator with XRE-family HTH domain